jgi:hypothetical protein
VRSLPFFSHLVYYKLPGMQNDWCNAKWLKNGKLRKAILSAFYNISQRNFGILLISGDALSSCDEIFVQAYLDQNFTHKGKGLLYQQCSQDFLVGRRTKGQPSCDLWVREITILDISCEQGLCVQISSPRVHDYHIVFYIVACPWSFPSLFWH